MSQTPAASIILVGDELIAEHTRDALGGPLAAELQSHGCRVLAKNFVPDDEQAIASAVAAALREKVHVVVVIGGLGPTRDDRTRAGVARGTKRELIASDVARDQIEKRYRERGRDVPEGARAQAMLPEGAELVPNPVGSAPGFRLQFGASWLFSLPGVPREFREMWRRNVEPVLRDQFAGAQRTAREHLHTTGLAESEVERRIAPLLERIVAENLPLRVSLLARPGEVEVVVLARADEEEAAKDFVDEAVAEVRDQLGDFIFGTGDDTLVSVVRGLLFEQSWTLATAESCTGGLLGGRVTELSGSSEFYRGGVIAYGNLEKQRLLGVSGRQLETSGAVSAEVASAMALGCRKNVGASVAISVTGIAGPEGGTADKPVGLVFVGVASPDQVRVARHTFTGDRDSIRLRAVAAALDEVRRMLSGLPTLGHPEDPEVDVAS